MCFQQSDVNLKGNTPAFKLEKFINFLNHALKSANETKFWLALAKDIAPSKRDVIDDLLKEVDELAKILGSSISKLKNK